MKKVITSPAAPAAVGPYSQAIEVCGTLFVSGQLPLNPADGSMPQCISEQTDRSLRNIEAILSEAGYLLSDVVKVTVLLDDMNNFAAMNEVYARYFTVDMPARICYQVVALPKGAKVEIDVIAMKG